MEFDTIMSTVIDRGGLGRLAAWHLPGGPVGPPAWWAATSNVAGGSGTEEGTRWPLAMEFCFVFYLYCTAAVN